MGTAAPDVEHEPASVPVRPAAPRRGRARAMLVTLRPRQWLKNGLVIAAAGAAGALGHDDVPVRVTLACLAFCLLSGGIYTVNDVRDREEDRHHPRKRHRPVAAGELDPRFALWFGVATMLAALIIAGAVRPLLALVALAYLALTLSYTLVWRRIVFLDILAIAGGFVLRAVAGGVAAPVALSRWFVLVITAAAVLVAAGKRYSELRRTQLAGTRSRSVLGLYSPRMLQWIIVGSGTVALFAYCVWALALPVAPGVPWRALTTPLFAGCLLRYGQLIRAGAGETPEELVLGDRPLALAGLAWLALFALSVNAGS